MTTIKICGITNQEDAYRVAEAGADLMGFVFYPKSPRYITVQEATSIVRAVRCAFGAGAPRFVGVFVDEPLDRVCAMLDLAKLDLAQLHGAESAAEVRACNGRAFKAVRPRTLDQAWAAVATYEDTVPDDDALPQLLVDAYHPQRPGGTGMQSDLGVAGWLARRVRLLLAGGLTPETVATAIEQVRPWGVDVSSGVEREKGLKDHARVGAFVQAVRAVDTKLRERQ